MPASRDRETTRSGFHAQTGILHFEEFAKFRHLLAVMTSRRAPGLVGDRKFNMHPETGEGREQGIENRRLLAGTLGVALEDTIWFDPDEPGDVVWVGAEHLGDGAEDWATRIRGASGIVAQCTNIMLATLCNDNVTVILFDPRMYTLGLVTLDTEAHSGAPVEQAIEMMIERGGALRNEIVGLIAPSVGPCCHSFPDPALGRGRKGNLWDVARTAMSRSNLRRDNMLNKRVCTACRDSEFFTRIVDGPDAGAGAVMAGVMDPDGALSATLHRRKLHAEALARRASRTQQASVDVASLSIEEARLNKAIRCPYGQNKVYIRSVLLGDAGGATQPVIALRCAVIAHVGLANEGHNIVKKDYIEQYCADAFEECEAYKLFMIDKKRKGRH